LYLSFMILCLEIKFHVLNDPKEFMWN
jgi:hypothetical protein